MKPTAGFIFNYVPNSPAEAAVDVVATVRGGGALRAAARASSVAIDASSASSVRAAPVAVARIAGIASSSGRADPAAAPASAHSHAAIHRDAPAEAGAIGAALPS